MVSRIETFETNHLKLSWLTLQFMKLKHHQNAGSVLRYYCQPFLGIYNFSSAVIYLVYLKTFTENWVRKTNLFCFKIDNGLNFFFFWNETFLLFKKLSAAVCNKLSWNFTKFQLNETTDRKDENNNCLNELKELKFCEVSRNWFQTDAEIFSFLSWKTKQFYS